MQESLKSVRDEPSEFANAFSKLYCSVMPDLYDVGCQKFKDNVVKQLKDIRRLKHFVLSNYEKEFFVDLKFEEIASRCAYMYSYSVLHTSATFREFTKHLESNTDLLVRRFSKKVLKICCLGGGPGLEAVGIVKAIHDAISKSEYKSKNSAVDVYVTVVDICSEWKSEESAIVEALNKNSNLFPSMIITFHANFCEADLLKPFEQNFEGILQEADIVTVVKFANTVEVKHPRDCIPKLESMMKRIVTCMRDGSCLFMLDSSGGVVFYRTAEILSTYRSKFMQMLKHNGYRLHPKTMKEFEGAMNFRKSAPMLFPTLVIKVSSCFWIKRGAPTKKEKISGVSMPRALTGVNTVTRDPIMPNK